MPRGCLEGVLRVSECNWKVSGKCLEDVLKLSGGSLEGVLRVSGAVWRVSGRCLEGVWRKCLEGGSQPWSCLEVV